MKEFDWINNINIYFIILEKINKHFKLLVKSMEHDEIEENFFYFSTELLRLVPFTEDKKNHILFLNYKDGICLLKKYIPFLEIDLQKILEENMDSFIKIKQIRNKYEHEPHNINSVFSTGHSSYSAMGFYCRTELISLNSIELTYIIYELNKLFDKIKDLIVKIENNNINQLNQFNKLHINNIRKFNFESYNKTYTRIPRNFGC